MGPRRFYEQYYSTPQGPRAAPSGVARLRAALSRFEAGRHEALAHLVMSLGHSFRVLDLGCGDGAFFGHFTGAHRLHGVDFVAGRLRRVERADALIVSADLDDTLPYRDASFDVVTSMSVMEHVFSVEHHLAEARRVLRPGGWFLLEVPNLAFAPNRLRLMLGRAPVTGDWSVAWDDNHLHGFTQADLAEYLPRFGFEVERVTGLGVFAALRNWWPSMLCADLVFVCRSADRTQLA